MIGGVVLPKLREVLSLGRQTVPFALNRLFGAVYLAGDVFYLQLFVSDSDLGLHRMASLLLVQLGTVSVMLNRVFFPWFSARAGDPASLTHSAQFAVRVALLISLPLGIGGALVAEPLIVLVGGEEYRTAWPVMAVLMLVVPTRFLNNALANLLSAVDRQVDRTWSTVLGAVALTIGALLVAPNYGILGVAWVTLVVDLVVLAFQVGRAADVLGRAGWGSVFGRLTVAVSAMVGVVYVLTPWTVWVQVVAGGATFSAVSLLTGSWRPADLRLLFRL
jgi:O-antigen/teichoic acid export membrane protein